MANMSNAFGNIIPRFEEGKEIKTEGRLEEFARDLEDVIDLVSYEAPAEVVNDGDFDIFPFTACGKGDFENSLRSFESEDSSYAKRLSEFFEKYSIKWLILEVQDYSISGYGSIYKIGINTYKLMEKKCASVNVFSAYDINNFPEECYEDGRLQDYLIEDYLTNLWIDVFLAKDGIKDHPEIKNRLKETLETLKEKDIKPWSIEEIALYPYSFIGEDAKTPYPEDLVFTLSGEAKYSRKNLAREILKVYYPKDYRVKLSLGAIKLIKENQRILPSDLVKSVEKSLKDNDFEEGAYWRLIAKEIAWQISTSDYTTNEAFVDVYYTMVKFQDGETVERFQNLDVLESEIFELAHYLELNSYLELKTEYKNLDSFEQAKICKRLYNSFIDEAIERDDYFINDFVREYNKVIDGIIEEAE